MNNSNQNQIIFSQGNTPFDIKVILEDDTVWLSQSQMSKLFNKDRNTINDHIRLIYKEEELDKSSTYRKFRLVPAEGFN